MPKRNLIWLALMLLVAVLAVWLARQWPLAPPHQETANPFELLIRLHDKVREHYVDEVPPQVLVGAIRGYLHELDPYCRYILPDQPDFLDRIIRGRRCNLGLHYQIVDQDVVVLGVLPRSPAAAAGLRPGDLLAAVGNAPLCNLSRAAVDALLDGPSGEPLRLAIGRQDKRLALEVAPAEYDVETVTGLCRRADGSWQCMVDETNHLAYIRIREFANGTAEAFDAMMRSLVEQGLAGLVLDLRDNPGGPLQEAVSVADSFLESGVIVITRGRASREERYMAHPDRTVPADVPVVVLVNGRTISAPELLAGALKKHRRALLVGTQTFGKDVIQSPYALGPGMGTVVLTTGRSYFEEPPATQPAAPTSAPAAASTPAFKAPARALRAEPAGIMPHLVEEAGDLAERGRREFLYRMEVLPAALPVSSTASTTRPQTAAADATAAELEQIRQVDTQLARALRLLRHPAAFEAFLSEEP
jgi:carboxyl-terminal processing protease